MDTEAIVPPLLLAEVVKPAIDDIGLFLEDLQSRENRLATNAPRAREQLEKQHRILTCTEYIEQNLQAVDASSIPLDRQSLSVVVAVGALIGNQQRAEVIYDRKSGENSEDFRSVATALRMRLELHLLQSVEQITIADHSFWSILMEANKIMTSYKATSRSQEVEAAFADTIKEAFGKNGSLFAALRNPRIVAISKSATSDRLSDELHIHPSIPDRTLLTAVLRPGEFLRPIPLIQATKGQFGVEHDIFDWQEIERIYRGSGSTRLMVTFYRPWEYQRAYRIEYHEEMFSQEKLPQLLGRIKYETRIRTIMEPMSQFLADMVCKQISEIAPLYIQSAMARYPNIMGPYRTGGYYGR